MKKCAFLVTAVLMATAAQVAQSAGGGLNTNQMYIGGGLGLNSVSGSDNGVGFQFFGGYHLGKVANNLEMDVEVGYMDTGDMTIEQCTTVPFFGNICASADASAQGLWATGVGRYAVNPQIDLIGRAGFDFGDDDGFMFGVGVGYNVNKQSQLRAEYVIRDNVDSIQVNYTFNLH